MQIVGKEKPAVGRALCNTWGADPSALPVCNHADCQLSGGTTKDRYKRDKRYNTQAAVVL